VSLRLLMRLFGDTLPASMWSRRLAIVAQLAIWDKLKRHSNSWGRPCAGSGSWLAKR